MNFIKESRKRLIDFLRASAILMNYYIKNHKQVIWIVGDGRSGTTWLSEIINFDKKYRDMFEPFHPLMNQRMENLRTFQYIRPDSTNETFYQLSKDIFSGKFHNSRVDSQNFRLFYKGLIINDIFANLFIKWVDVNFSNVKKILIMRHPFAVSGFKKEIKKLVLA